ncbi:hypothetical protein C8Q79DRAFT_198867 [Trametes meyenii]|nr:hypothetical protein C8Q79DRAFT_198867 [Trametes meyenii]
MPPTATKRSAPRKTAGKRSQPYDRSERAKALATSPVAGSTVAPQATPACSEIHSTPTVSSATSTSTGPSTSSVPCTARVLLTTQ